jgi:hypothetical protein
MSSAPSRLGSEALARARSINASAPGDVGIKPEDIGPG